MPRTSVFSRPGDADAPGQVPDPLKEMGGKLLLKAIESAVIAAVIYFVMARVQQPAELAKTVAEQGTHLAVLEQGVGDMREDIREIKRAVVKR